MSAGVYTIVCEQGSSFRLDLTYTNNDGTPIHLGGYQAQMDIRRSRVNNSRMIAQLSTENGRVHISAPETGEIRLAMSSEDTAELPPGDYFYDLVVWQNIINDANNQTFGKEVIRVIEGNFVVRAGVTVV